MRLVHVFSKPENRGLTALVLQNAYTLSNKLIKDKFPYLIKWLSLWIRHAITRAESLLVVIKEINTAIGLARTWFMLSIVCYRHFCSFWQYNVFSTYWNSNGNERCCSHCWFVLYCYKHLLIRLFNNNCKYLNNIIANPNLNLSKANITSDSCQFWA